MAIFEGNSAAIQPSNEEECFGYNTVGLIAGYNRNRDCDRSMAASSPIRSENAPGMPDGHLIGAQCSLAADQTTDQSWGDTREIVYY